MRSTPDSAVLILNYNAGPMLAECLRSLSESDARALPVLLVDNASSDDSVARARAARPDLEVVALSHNGGFAAGVNEGVRRLLERNIQSILLLNPDTQVAPEFFAPLARALERGFDLCGPKLWFGGFDGRPPRIWSAGGAATFGLNLCRLCGHGEIDHGQYDRSREVSFLPGTVWLWSRRLIETVGLLDEDFFLYLEDLDYCLRARRAGFRLWYESASTVVHVASFSSGGGYTRLRKYLNAFGSRRLLQKHAGAWEYLKFVGCDVLTLPLALCAGVFQGRGEAAWWKLRGLVDGFLGRTLTAERRAQLLRKPGA